MSWGTPDVFSERESRHHRSSHTRRLYEGSCGAPNASSRDGFRLFSNRARMAPVSPFVHQNEPDEYAFLFLKLYNFISSDFVDNN